jgi:hypothetical protein
MKGIATYVALDTSLVTPFHPVTSGVGGFRREFIRTPWDEVLAKATFQELEHSGDCQGSKACRWTVQGSLSCRVVGGCKHIVPSFVVGGTRCTPNGFQIRCAYLPIRVPFQSCDRTPAALVGQ